MHAPHFPDNPGFLRRRRREGDYQWLARRRQQERVARRRRAERTAQRLGVQLIAWGVCPACGCIGAPNHRCAKPQGERP